MYTRKATEASLLEPVSLEYRAPTAKKTLITIITMRGII